MKKIPKKEAGKNFQEDADLKSTRKKHWLFRGFSFHGGGLWGSSMGKAKKIEPTGTRPKWTRQVILVIPKSPLIETPGGPSEGR